LKLFELDPDFGVYLYELLTIKCTALQREDETMTISSFLLVAIQIYCPTM